MLSLQEEWQLLQVENSKMLLSVGQAVRADYNSDSLKAMRHYEASLDIEKSILNLIDDLSNTILKIDAFLPGNLRDEFISVSKSISRAEAQEAIDIGAHSKNVNELASRDDDDAIVGVSGLLRACLGDYRSNIECFFDELRKAKNPVENGDLYDALMLKSFLEEKRTHPLLNADRAASDAILMLGLYINKFSDLTNKTAIQSSIPYDECSQKRGK